MNKTVIAVIIILVAGFGGYMLVKSNKAKDVMENTTPTDTMYDDTMDTPDEGSTTGTQTNVNIDTGVVKTDTKVTAQTKEFTVVGTNFAFAPSSMQVNKGDTVKITFKNSGGFHDLKIDEFNVATKQLKDGAQETITFVADKAGSFEYYCTVGSHRAMGMKGTLIVK